MTLEPLDSTVENSSTESINTKTGSIKKRSKAKVIAVGSNLVVTAPVTTDKQKHSRRTPSITDISTRNSKIADSSKGGRLRRSFAFSTVAVFVAAFALPAVASGTNAFVDNGGMVLAKTETVESVNVDNLAIKDTLDTSRDSFKGFNELANAYRGSGLKTGYSNPNGAVRWPFPYPVALSATYGPRVLSWCTACGDSHEGIDITPGLGTPIQAIADGVVVHAETKSWGLGVNVYVEHVINGQRITSVYGHMLRGSLQVGVGDVIEVGTIIGKVGRTGWASGPHLHFEIKVNGSRVDPYKWMYENVSPL
ncbi:MAG: M23 family metallopeptidase [Microbacteriaceae bacterium]|nr:M23 family metallopeptidase [Microbacteriaceae bacterium]